MRVIARGCDRSSSARNDCCGPQSTLQSTVTIRRLQTRILALFALMTFVVQLGAIVLINTVGVGAARKTLGEELVRGARVFDRLKEQDTERLVQGARLLSADYAFRDAVSSGDGGTIASPRRRGVAATGQHAYAAGTRTVRTGLHRRPLRRHRQQRQRDVERRCGHARSAIAGRSGRTSCRGAAEADRRGARAFPRAAK